MLPHDLRVSEEGYPCLTLFSVNLMAMAVSTTVATAVPTAISTAVETAVSTVLRSRDGGKGTLLISPKIAFSWQAGAPILDVYLTV